jgi:hypothetical protein
MTRRKTTEEFIDQAIAVHGDTYDYSKVDYKNAHTKVHILCSEHGEFLQTPANHLSGKGCRDCGLAARSQKLTSSLEEFIEKAKGIHGDTYDYSKVGYVNTHTNVAILCQEHGEFLQTPAHHLSGQGCGTCAGNQRSTTKEFIDKAGYWYQRAAADPLRPLYFSQ